MTPFTTLWGYLAFGRSKERGIKIMTLWFFVAILKIGEIIMISVEISIPNLQYQKDHRFTSKIQLN